MAVEPPVPWPKCPTRPAVDPWERRERERMAINKPFGGIEIPALLRVVFAQAEGRTVSREVWAQAEAEREVDAMLKGEGFTPRPWPGETK